MGARSVGCESTGSAVRTNAGTGHRDVRHDRRPHLAPARRHGALAAADPASAARLPELADRWLEVDRKARIIVTDQLRLLWSNRAAEEIFAGGELEVREGSLFAGDAIGQERLARFVAAAGLAIATLPIRSRDGESHLLLRSQRLGGDGAGAFVGLQIVHTAMEMGKPMHALYAGVEEAFGLTPAESRVLGALVEGRTADETARMHGLSIDTVRSQIRHIYGKMGVSSREGLFRRISAFAI